MRCECFPRALSPRTIHVFWDFDPQSPSADPTEADSTQSCVAGGETSARSLRICQDPFTAALNSFLSACTDMKFQETVQEHAKEYTCGLGCCLGQDALPPASARSASRLGHVPPTSFTSPSRFADTSPPPPPTTYDTHLPPTSFRGAQLALVCFLALWNVCIVVVIGVPSVYLELSVP